MPRKQIKASVRRRRVLKKIQGNKRLNEAEMRTYKKMKRSPDAPSGTRYSEMTNKERSTSLKKEIAWDTARQLKEDRYKLKQQIKRGEGDEFTKQLAKAKPATTAQKQQRAEYNKKMLRRRQYQGAMKRLKQWASESRAERRNARISERDKRKRRTLMSPSYGVGGGIGPGRKPKR